MMARKPTVKVGLSLLVWLLGIIGCAADKPLDLSSYDPSHDQITIARYYRDQAVVMREKAHAQATAAARYEALFGSDADIVYGAKLLARYYEQIAQELERVAETHETMEGGTSSVRSRAFSPRVPDAGYNNFQP